MGWSGWSGTRWDEVVVGHGMTMFRHTEELLAVSVARMYYIIVMRLSLPNE